MKDFEKSENILNNLIYENYIELNEITPLIY